MLKEKKSAESNTGSCVWRIVQAFGWITGLVCLSVPYNVFWKLGNGNLGYNILNTLTYAVVGIIMVMLPVKLIRRRVAESSSGKGLNAFMISAYLVAFTGAVGCFFFGWPEWLGIACIGSCVLALWGTFAVVQLRVRKPVQSLTWLRWMKFSWKCNGLFWISIFILLAGSDLYALASIDSHNASEQLSSSLGRITTQAVCVLGLMALFQCLIILTPKFFRPLVILGFSLLPFVIIADFLLKQYWNQSLLTIVNLFTSSGSFDLNKEIAASGLELSSVQLIAIAISIVAVCVSLFFLLRFFSLLAGFRITNRLVAGTAMVCWFLTVAEAGLSYSLKRSEEWQRHHKVFGTHIGIFAPPSGFEKFDIAFRQPSPDLEREKLLEEIEDSPQLQKPDVYVFMIESWRSDSITPEVAPFLHRFRNDEAQDLGRTFAGSNCTPLSWFSMFHSRLAIHWSNALKEQNSAAGLTGAYPLKVLKKLGYEIQVRAVCDLSYKNMGPLNFGSGNSLADHIIDDSEQTGSRSIPEREKIVMRDQREYIDSNPTAPQFHFTALDSPHYNYSWPSDFQQLHSDCAGDLPVKLRPSDEVVGEVVRRYQNAVHWIDYAIEEFVDFLKFKGRYGDSVIIITGDHGEEFQEEGSWFHCSSLNRFQTEVPIIIKWPDWVADPPPQDNVSHYDVMPSLLNAIGLEPKFYEGLAGQSLFHYPDVPREAVLSTVHRGESGIGFCIIREERKVKFSFPGPWSTDVPTQLVVCEYSDVFDRPMDFREDIGELTHADYIRKQFPEASGRFFERFEKH